MKPAASSPAVIATPTSVTASVARQSMQFADKPMQAVQGADALIIVTEWKAYRSPNWTALKAAMKAPVIFDGRNLYEPNSLQKNGIDYVAIGRSSLRDVADKIYSRDLFGQD